jgi:hypothetical protein
MDPLSGEIMIAELTGNGKGAGDGGYDGIEFRRAVERIKAEVIVPPPKDSTVH